jgi:hypothetical protein
MDHKTGNVYDACVRKTIAIKKIFFQRGVDL